MADFYDGKYALFEVPGFDRDPDGYLFYSLYVSEEEVRGATSIRCNPGFISRDEYDLSDPLPPPLTVSCTDQPYLKITGDVRRINRKG